MTAWHAAALFLLPESPRWLVVNGRLDEALAVIQRILTGSTLPDGALLANVMNHTLQSRWCQSHPRLDVCILEQSLIRQHVQSAAGLLRDAGSQASTADAERELMELWSAVEKDKEAARERALAARRAQLARLRHQVLNRPSAKGCIQTWFSHCVLLYVAMHASAAHGLHRLRPC